MAEKAFSDGWVATWADVLNSSEDYRNAAARWEGEIVIVMRVDPAMGITEKMAVYVDLWHGECREARVASDDDLEAVPYIISASPENWRRILKGNLDPILALMGGKLLLKKSSLISMLPYVKAAKELVVAAARVETEFHEEWE